MSKPLPQKIFIIRQPDGQVINQPLSMDALVSAQAENGYAIIDQATGKTPENLVAKRRGDDLVVEIDGEPTLVIEGFFLADAALFIPQAQLTENSLSGEALASSNTNEIDDGGVIWPQDGTDSGLITPVLWGTGIVGVLALALGGGGSDDPTAPPTITPEPAASQINGLVLAGPVIEGNGLWVDVFAADGETLLGTAQLDASGQFTLDIEDYTGVVIAKVRDGNDGADYLDEATGQAVDLNAELMALGVVSEAGSSITLNINPITTLATQWALSQSAGDELTPESVAAANQSLAELFGLDNLHELVPAATNGGVFNGNDGLDAAEVYGLMLAAFSGADQQDGGNSQGTINDVLAAISTDESGNLILSEQGQAILLAGAERVNMPSGDTVTDSIAPILDTYAPEFTSDPSPISLSENSGAAQTVFTAQAADASNITYSIKQGQGDDASLFSIDAQTGELTLTHNPDHESQTGYQLTVIATDSAGHSREQTLTLNVDDLDESAPSITSAATAPAIEDSGAGQVIYSATATDTADIDDNTDTSAQVTYRLKEVDDFSQLSIDASTGDVTLIASPDFDTQSSYQFTVVATDAAGNSTEQAVSFNIDEVADVTPPPPEPDTTAPVFSSGTNASIAENAGTGNVVYTANATDNSGDVTYSLTAGSDAAMSINASTGAVTLADNPDHEAQANYSFTIVATDATGNSSQRTVTLTVNDADESAPTITSGATATAVDENSGAAQVVYTATATDTADVDDATDTTGQLTYSLQAGSDAGLSIDSTTGAVTLTGNPDHETQASYSFTVVATDAAGNSSEQAATLGINDLDDSIPSFTSGTTATAIDENSGTAQVVYTAIATDTADVDDATDTSGDLTYTLKAGSDAALNIDANTGAVTLTSNPDFETQASYSFTVVATDAAGNSTEQAVTLNVNDLDESAPTITSGATATAIDENTAAGQVIYTAVATDTADVDDATNTSDDLTYTLKTVDDYALVSINSGTGAVTLTDSPDHETKASYSFTVIATDAAGNSTEQAVTLNINDLDESTPAITSGATATAIDENTAAGQVIYTAVATDTADVDDTTDTSGDLAYTLKAVDDHGLVSINGSTGAVTLTDSPDHETQASYSFTVIATDAAGNSTEQAVTLDINDLDDTAPTITSGATATAIAENSGAGQVIYIVTSTDNADVTTGTTTYSLKAEGDHALLSIDANTGEVTLTADPDFETKANYSFTVIATDADGNFSEQAVSLSINDIADETAPTVSSVAITSATGIQNSTVNTGDVITATVTMSETTDVDTTNGTPRLALNIGGNSVYATYAGGSGTAALTFTYTVQAGDTDADGISVDADALNANGGTLEDAAGNTAVLTHSAVADNVSYLVDTTAPTAQVILNPIQHLLEPGGVIDGNDQDPQIITLGAEGAFAVTWMGIDAGGDYSIFVQRFDSSGSTIGTPILLEPDGVTDSDDRYPQLTPLGTDGAFAVTWRGIDAGGDSSIFVQRFDESGTVVGTPILLEPDGVTDDLDVTPQLTALGSDGAFAVTWSGYDAGGDYSIFVQRFDSAGAQVGTPLLLEATGVTNAYDLDPQITPLGSNGAFAVTWSGYDGGEASVFVQRFDSSGTPVGTPILLEPIGVTDRNDASPQITPLGNDGAFVVTWHGQDSGLDQSIFVQRFDSSGAVVGTPLLLEPSGVTDGPDNFPQITALGSDGRFAVAWRGWDADGSYSIFIQLFDNSGTSVGAPVQLEPDGVMNGYNADPRITELDSEGAFAVTWSGDDSNGDLSIYVQRFDSSGAVVGTPILLEPNGVTDGSDIDPQITPLNIDGAFAVTWYGHDADGDYSIFVQRFNADGTPVLESTTMDALGSVTVQSTEVGTAYLVHDSITVTSVSDITSADNQYWNQATIATANTDVSVAATGLADGNYQVYTADAAGNLSAAAATNITIDNTPPSFTSGATATAIDENSGAGQVVYDADATDVTDLTYTLKAVDDHADFTIDATTGEVTLTGDPDFEAQNSYNFTVVATDALGNNSEQGVSLSINNTAPTAQVVLNPLQHLLEPFEATNMSDQYPQITHLGGNGAFVVVWSGYDGVGFDQSIFVQRFDSSGNQESSPVLLEPLGVTGGQDRHPQITPLGSDGAFVVAWLGYDGGDQSIFVQRFDSSGTVVGSPHLLEPTGVNASDWSPQITPLGSEGAFVVAWEGFDGNDRSIFVQYFDSNGVVTGSPIMLEPTNVDDSNDLSPQLTALGDDGTFVVAWEGVDTGGDLSIFVQRFDSNGSINGTPLLVEPFGVTNSTDWNLQITPLGSEGAFAITWAGGDSDGDRSIFVQRFDSSGGTIGTPLLLEPDSVLDGLDNDPQITPLGSDGAFAVVWHGQDSDGDLSIFLQRFDSTGATIGVPLLIEPAGVTTGDDNYPQITQIGSDGAFAVTWYGIDSGGDQSIFVQRFDNSGGALGLPLLLEPLGVTNGEDFYPQLTALGAEGAFAVTWFGPDADGDQSIFVQRFNADGTPVLESTTMDASGSVTVQSTEPGTAYVVHDSITVNNLSDITGADDQYWNQAAIATANTDVSVAATGLADGNYQVYTADAAGNVSAAAATNITIDNTAPSFISGATATAIDENSGSGQTVYTAAATDVTGLTYTLKAVDDHADFTIDATTGEVTLTGDPDFETQSSYSFTVVATDALGNSAEQAVTLGVNDIADETAPTVSSVAITSATGIQNSTVNAGDVVTATVTMSEATNVDTTNGTPRLALNIGGNTVYATYAGGSGTTALTFTYAVQPGDTDINGISIDANALDANGGTMEDAAGNSAVTNHSAVGDNTSYTVDTTAPTLSSSTPADNAAAVAVDGNIILTFSENVQAGSGNIVISDGSDTRNIAVNDAQVSISGNTVTINPTTDLNEDATYNVQIANGVLTDAAGNAYAGINDATNLNFTTESGLNTSVVVFDMVDNWTSDHSGRTFNASETYTIYLRVDTENGFADLNSGGANWGVWQGASNLGSDDRIVLVGSSGTPWGPFGPASNPNLVTKLDTFPTNGTAGFNYSSATGVVFGYFNTNTTNRDYNFATRNKLENATLWTGTAPVSLFTGKTFNQMFTSQALPASVLNSQGV